MKVILKKGRRRGSKNICKFYKNLATSLKVQGRVFFEHSTLHGVRYIAENGRPFLEQFMWFACVSIGAVATAVIIVSLWDKFQTNPTITGLDTDYPNWQVSFPGITVCQEIPYNLSRVEEYFEQEFPEGSSEYSVELLEQLTILSYATAKEFSSLIKPSKVDQLELKSVAFKLMNRCEEVFDECEFKSYKIDCCAGFFPVFTERGFCYTFNARKYEKHMPWNDTETPAFKVRYIKETDPKWSLKFRVKNNSINMPIYIHHPDEQVGLDTQPQHIWEYKVEKISFSDKVTYTTEDTRQLSIKQRRCVFSDEIKLKIDKMYTMTGCTRQCRMENSMRHCKCVPYFYPEGGHYKHCNLQQWRCVGENLKSIKDVDHCSCQLACINAVYEVEKLTVMYVGNIIRAKKWDTSRQ